MRNVPALTIVSVIFSLAGCSTTKTIVLHTETKVVTGEQISCVYHSDNLYCVPTLIKSEDIDRRQIMDKVVSLVHSEETGSDMKEGGAFLTKFQQKPKEYSLLNCSNTGVADPAFQCTLLREADQKLVAEQEQRIRLNESGERILQSGLAEQDVIAKCGAPIEQKDDVISHTIYYRSGQAGQDAEVRFSTIEKPMRLDHIESVQDTKAHDFIPGGMFWTNFSRIGNTDEERIADIRQYFPCILK